MPRQDRRAGSQPWRADLLRATGALIETLSWNDNFLPMMWIPPWRRASRDGCVIKIVASSRFRSEPGPSLQSSWISCCSSCCSFCWDARQFLRLDPTTRDLGAAKTSTLAAPELVLHCSSPWLRSRRRRVRLPNMFMVNDETVRPFGPNDYSGTGASARTCPSPVLASSVGSSCCAIIPSWMLGLASKFADLIEHQDLPRRASCGHDRSELASVLLILIRRDDRTKTLPSATGGGCCCIRRAWVISRWMV